MSDISLELQEKLEELQRELEVRLAPSFALGMSRALPAAPFPCTPPGKRVHS